MMKTIFTIIRPKYTRAIIYHILATVVRIAIPYILKEFLREIKKDTKDNIKLVILASGATLLTFIEGVLKEHAIANTCGCKAMTGQIIRCVFLRKLTVCSHSFLKVANESFINKMILYELDHMLSFIGELPKLWATPINLVLSFYFIYITLDWRLILVFIVFLVGMILLGLLKSRSVSALRGYQASEVKRSTRIAECIPRMKSVKMNDMTTFFRTKLSKIRIKSTNFLGKLSIYDSIADSIFEGTPLFCSILIIGSLALFEGGLDTSQAFAAISVLEILSGPLNALASSFDRMEAYSSAKEAFKLFLEEVPEQVDISIQAQNLKKRGAVIIMENCSFDFVIENQMSSLVYKMMGRKWKEQKKIKGIKKKKREMGRKSLKSQLKRKQTKFDIFSGNFRSESLSEEGSDFSSFDKKRKEKMERLKKEKAKYQTLLKNLSIVIKRGQKVCLVGKPGSGFSEFLLALMGEAKKSKFGQFSIKGSVSYLNIRMENFVSGTINDNIILGGKPDDVRLKKVMKLLKINLKNLRGEGFHQVLEGAKNLSVELQKKILLARWIYKEKEIYLMDDLFDDLNRTEWNNIYQRLFLEELKKKTVIYMSYNNVQIKVLNSFVNFYRWQT